MLFLTAPAVEGATYVAASTKGSDVQAKINIARDGDTVVVPAGTARWTTQLSITKNLTLKGAGIGQTVIFDEVPRSPQVHTMDVVYVCIHTYFSTTIALHQQYFHYYYHPF